MFSTHPPVNPWTGNVQMAFVGKLFTLGYWSREYLFGQLIRVHHQPKFEKDTQQFEHSTFVFLLSTITLTRTLGTTISVFWI